MYLSIKHPCLHVARRRLLKETSIHKRTISRCDLPRSAKACTRLPKQRFVQVRSRAAERAALAATLQGRRESPTRRATPTGGASPRRDALRSLADAPERSARAGASQP